MRVRPRERENFDEIVSTIKRAKKSKTKNDNRGNMTCWLWWPWCCHLDDNELEELMWAILRVPQLCDGVPTFDGNLPIGNEIATPVCIEKNIYKNTSKIRYGRREILITFWPDGGIKCHPRVCCVGKSRTRGEFPDLGTFCLWQIQCGQRSSSSSLGQSRSTAGKS